jgi:hypothetical protein
MYVLHIPSSVRDLSHAVCEFCRFLRVFRKFFVQIVFCSGSCFMFVYKDLIMFTNVLLLLQNITSNENLRRGFYKGSLWPQGLIP